MGTKDKNYYELLGVDQKASLEEIKTAYKELARIFHPDSHYFDDLLGEAAAPSSDDQTFKAITNAYNHLINPEKRLQYDRLLPRALAGWEDENIPSGFDDGRFDGKPRPSSAHARAFGVFGKVDSSAGDTAATPEEDIPNLEPVLLRRTGFFARLRRWLWG